jgi:two-component system sensor histidine kinase KdpD
VGQALKTLRVAVTFLSRAAGVAAAIGVITYGGFRVFSINASTAGFAYLLAILLIATFWGLWESIGASFAAVLCFNYFFLPPIFRFTIADSNNWVALFTFLATAVVVSKLADSTRRQTIAANDRRLEMERLYALSRAVLLIQSNDEMVEQAARHAAEAFEIPAVSLYDRATGQIYRAGRADIPEWDERLREVALRGTLLRDDATHTLVTAVRLGAEPIGSIALRGVTLSDSALQAFVNLVAIVLERARTLDAANRADVARQSQELKSTLLDAIAHEFKTPLTSIRAAASALRSTPPVPVEAQREFAAIVDEESERLGRLVTEAIQMARIEAGRVHLDKRPHTVQELVDHAIAGMNTLLEGRAVERDILADMRPIDVDGELMEIALRQILDNAVKYSAAGSPLGIRSLEREGRVLICVRNEGRGIPEAAQSRIFEKFYRAPGEGGRVPGTGMGLAIAHDIVKAHNGQIWVESSPGAGAEICISVPAA